jgi:uncharacterized protein (TIGR00730 family)
LNHFDYRAGVAITSVCVYCGSSRGHGPVYAEAAAALGKALVGEGIRLVYGGGRVGLMGVLADAALDAGGEVVGVIPSGLFRREVGRTGLTELVEVGSMHERKQRMFELADAFVALPGGFGTLEEVAEVTTWSQLGMHRKPIALLDVDGYWDGLVALLDRAVDEGLLRPDNRALLALVRRVDGVLPALRDYDVPPRTRWVDETQT